MLLVKPVPRDEIDSWTIAESGLPARVVNSASVESIRTVGELRTWSNVDLLRLRSLGRISLKHINQFFLLCGQVERGTKSFMNFEELLRLFLDQNEYEVLTQRYGFAVSGERVSRKSLTLQEIGTRHHKTRERIRQIEDTAKARLQSRIGQVCLAPFCEYFQRLLHSAGMACACSALMPLIEPSLFHPHNPCAVLLLLCDITTAGLAARNGYFSTLAEAALAELEQQAMAALAEAGAPLHIEMLAPRIRRPPALDAIEDLRRVLTVALDHCPGVAATGDERYFLFSAGVASFLIEVLHDVDRPAHFRAITQAINDRLKPRSRKGAGYILELLNSHPACVRMERGIYDLRA